MRRWMTVILLLAMTVSTASNARASKQEDFFRSMSEGIGGGKNSTAAQSDSSDSASSTGNSSNHDSPFSVPTQPIDWAACFSAFLPFALLAGGLGTLATWYAIRERQPARRTANQSRKLIRQISRSVGLKRAEVRQLKLLADALAASGGVRVSHPLSLMLCPSVMTQAVVAAGPRVDRVIVAKMARRLMMNG